MPAIHKDAAESTNDDTDFEFDLGPEINEDEAAEEMLRGFLPPEEGTDASKKKPPVVKKDEEENEDDTDEDDEDAEDSAEEPETEGDDDETDGADEKSEKTFTDGDDVYTKITVNDEEHEVSLKSLKRLYGQEASLTKKSMEVAEQRKVADADLQRQAASSTALLARARERFEPFSKLDFHLLATQLPPEDYTVLRQSAQAAYEDVAFLEQHQDGFVKAIAERTQTTLREKAVKSLAILSGPTDKGGIDGWTEKLYDEIRAHAVANGAPAEVINQLTDAWAIRLIHEAMLYRRGKVKSDGKSKVVVKKINKTPKRIVKTSNDAATKGSKTLDANRAMKRLANSGSTDDAAAALLAGWANQDSDD